MPADRGASVPLFASALDLYAAATDPDAAARCRTVGVRHACDDRVKPNAVGRIQRHVCHCIRRPGQGQYAKHPRDAGPVHPIHRAKALRTVGRDTQVARSRGGDWANTCSAPAYGYPPALTASAGMSWQRPGTRYIGCVTARWRAGSCLQPRVIRDGRTAEARPDTQRVVTGRARRCKKEKPRWRGAFDAACIALRLTRYPGNSAAFRSGWGGAACAGPWLRSGGCARG